MALLGLLAVRRGQSLDAPFCREGDVIILQLPDVGGEGSAVGVGLFVEGVAVCVVPLLKGVGLQADILFALLLRRDFTLSIVTIQNGSLLLGHTLQFRNRDFL